MTTPNLPPYPKPDAIDGEPRWFDRHMDAYALAAYQAGQAARSAPWPTHEFAIVIDRTHQGEGPSLAIWNGVNYQFSDGDCYERDPDGTLDGYTSEWLTHHQIEQRLFTKEASNG